MSEEMEIYTGQNHGHDHFHFLYLLGKRAVSGKHDE